MTRSCEDLYSIVHAASSIVRLHAVCKVHLPAADLTGHQMHYVFDLYFRLCVCACRWRYSLSGLPSTSTSSSHQKCCSDSVALAQRQSVTHPVHFKQPGSRKLLAVYAHCPGQLCLLPSTRGEISTYLSLIHIARTKLNWTTWISRPVTPSQVLIGHVRSPASRHIDLYFIYWVTDCRHSELGRTVLELLFVRCERFHWYACVRSSLV